MKKTFFFGLICSLFAFSSVFAFDQINFQVENISQANQNALSVGANLGDVLRFDIDAMPLNGMQKTLSVDISGLISNAEVIDTGFGVLQGNSLDFPVHEGSDMSFFARVNGTCASGEAKLTVSSETFSVNIPLNCEDDQNASVSTTTEELPYTGASTMNVIFMISVIVLIVLIGGSFFVKKQE